MGKKNKLADNQLPFGHTTIITVLTFVAALGGYGGYYVSENPPGTSLLRAEYETQTHRVTRVIDGDTIELENGSDIRLFGIDSPELDQCYGPEAKQYLQNLVLGRDVILQKDSTATDELGRLLRYVFLHEPDPKRDQIFINNDLIRQGYARSDSRAANRRYEQLLNNSMGLAKRENRGMHAACGPEDDILVPANDTCVIKGNNDTGTANDIFYVPGCFSYSRIDLKWSEGDQYFCSESAAIAAGYRKATNCPE